MEPKVFAFGKKAVFAEEYCSINGWKKLIVEQSDIMRIISLRHDVNRHAAHLSCERVSGTQWFSPEIINLITPAIVLFLSCYDPKRTSQKLISILNLLCPKR